jgi:hypothetical protein
MSTKATGQLGANRRGTVLVGVLIALSLFMLLVAAVVVAGARDSAQSVDRLAMVRAEYNAEAAANIALRELVLNSDVDGNGTVGTFNPAAMATLNGGSLSATATPGSGITTIDVSGRATGTTGSTASGSVHSANRLTVRRGSAVGMPGLMLHAWENTGWQNISSFNWQQAPQRIGWVPNIDNSNRGSGEGMYRGQTSSVNLRFLGRITIPTTGVWNFRLDHDDGIELLINGVRVIFFDPGTGCRASTGSIDLTAGVHSFELRFNDGGGAQCLILYWTPPSGALAVIPPSAFAFVPTETMPTVAVADTAAFNGSSSGSTATNILVQGYRNVDGPWSGTPLANAVRVATDTNANSRITVTDGARLEGHAISAVGSTPSSSISMFNGGTITGTLSAASTSAEVRRSLLPMVNIPTGWAPSSEGAVGVWSGSITFAGDRRFSSFDIGNSAVINVTAPSRVVVDGAFNMSGSSQLVIAAGASLDLYVLGAVTFSTNVLANVSNNPDRLRIYRVGSASGEVRVSDNSRLHAHVVNPYGAVNLWNNGQPNCEFIGTIRANNLAVSNNVRLRIDAGPAPMPFGPPGGSTAITSWFEP